MRHYKSKPQTFHAPNKFKLQDDICNLNLLGVFFTNMSGRQAMWQDRIRVLKIVCSFMTDEIKYENI